MTRLRAAAVVTPDGVLEPGRVDLVGDRIDAVGADPGAAPVGDDLLVPGFVDLQVNGLGPVDVAAAEGPDWDRLDAALLAAGVTTWCPTLVSPTDALLAATCRRVAAAAARRPAPRPHLAGVHVEGPFLTLPGAHDPSRLRPGVDAAWVDALPPEVAVVTIAPDLPGALDAVAALVGRGVLVAIGHSACSAEEAHAAAGAGARLVTHLGNASGALHQRAPGLVGAALVDDRLCVSVIADGVHLHPDFLRLVLRAKGPGRTVLVTDAVADGTTEGVAPDRPAGLAGSHATMPEVLATALATGAPLADAVAAAAATPAALLGLDDRGALAPGRRADVVRLRRHPAGGLTVTEVWIGGALAWSL